MENVKGKQNKELVLTRKAESNLLQFTDIKQALTVLDPIVKSEFCPLKKKEDALAAVLLGEELGVGKMTALSNIYSVNGKLSIGFHVANALMLKNGITYEIIEDCVPVYSYIDIESKDKYDEDMLKNISDVTGKEIQVVFYHGSDDEKKKQKEDYLKKYKGKICVLRYKSDLRSTVEFKRKIKQIDNSITEMIIKVSYCYSEVPERLKKDDGAWKSHTAQMLTNRAILIGGRRIAGDVLNGMYEHSEALDVEGIKYDYSDEGISFEDESGETINFAIAKEVKEEVDETFTSEE